MRDEENTAKIITGVDVKTQPDSWLLVVNDPAEVAKRFGDDVATIPDGYKPEYYVWTGRKLLLIEGGKIGREPRPFFERCKERRKKTAAVHADEPVNRTDNLQ